MILAGVRLSDRLCSNDLCGTRTRAMRRNAAVQKQSSLTTHRVASLSDGKAGEVCHRCARAVGVQDEPNL
jgi:hypothetical protein